MKEENKTFFKKYKKEIFIIVISLLVFSSLIYFLFLNKKTDSAGNKIGVLPSLGLDSLFGEKNNPNSNNIDASNTISNSDVKDEDLTQNEYFEGLIKIWDKPVAGYGMYEKTYTYKDYDENLNEKTVSAKKTMLQFVDSETGYIYEKDLWDPESAPYQVSKQSYPNIVRAYFMNSTSDGKGRVFMQYEDNGVIKTISATVPEYYGSTLNLLNITNLPDNIKYITTSPDNTKIAYIVSKNKITNGYKDSSTDWYYIDTLNNTYGSKFYASEFSYWKLSILNNGNIYAYNTDSYSEPNTLFKVNKSSNGQSTLTQIYTEHTGMSFLINKNSLLTSIFTASGLKTYKMNFSEKSFADNDLTPLNFTTLSNKCTQNSESLIICSVPKNITTYEYGLPDAWYQGMTSWDDNLYVVSDTYPSGSLLFDIHQDSTYTDMIDAKDLKINNLKTHLAFINKNDGSLWSLNIQNILDTNY